MPSRFARAVLMAWVMLFLYEPAGAGQDGTTEITETTAEENQSNIKQTNTGVALATQAISFFQKNISSTDGIRCSMYPSCSRYSQKAFEKHGFWMGWIMTCDRLLRCGRDELKLSPRIVIGARVQCYDPVENNDFWWTK